MDPSGKPVGRSRGRARGVTAQTQGQPGQSAFGRPATAPPAHAPPPDGITSVGRSVRARAPGTADSPIAEKAVGQVLSGTASAGGEGSGVPSSLGRGAMRGRQVVCGEIINTRPTHVVANKKGTSGRPVQLTSNYFKILSKPDWCLYQYRVDFSPEEDHTGTKKGLLRLHKERLGSYIFDGTVLYSANRLTPMGQPIDLYSKRQTDGEDIRIVIRLVGEMGKGDPHYLQFYNILTRKCLESLELQLVGRNFFDAKAKVEVREFNFSVWPGYLTSIRQHENDVLMCAEINHKIMRQETILHIMTRTRESARGNFQSACRAEVIGLTVLTDYNNNTYRIDDIDFDVNPTSTFESKKDKTQISYKDYYKNRYGITIREERQPLLVTRSKARSRRAGDDEIIYLVPELCRATGLTDAMRNDFRLMSALAQYTRVTPDKRIEKLLNFNRRLANTPAIVEEFKNWDLSLEKDLVKVTGRCLNREDIMFGNSKTADGGNEGDWTRAIRDNSLFFTTPLKQWFVMTPEKVARDAKSFVAAMARSTKNFMMSEPQFIEIGGDNSRTYTDNLEKILSRQQPQLVFCVLMKNRADTYSAIKKMLCLDRPVPSQVVTARCFNPKGMMSIATKVAIQLNCKIGGIPWTVRIPLGGLMVVGYDVCHDTQKRGTDYGAMVASLDRQLTRYFSAVSAHSNGEELSNHLTINMAKALRKYQEVNNGALPSHILFFRDGVGEGQVPFVVDHEVKYVREAIAKFYNSVEQVKLAYILVTKRINTRFFQDKKNPLPGTIVDDVVTNPIKYDFFLISQSVKQGTVAPTCYSVISDSMGLTPDKIQILTFKMTHIYFNCSTTMRVPAPVQFAHKLAFLVSQSVHGSPTSNHLESLLYFL